MKKNNQRGAALIVVLIMLVLLTIIGTWAVRQSTVSLNISTNSQVQQLLMQSSDAVFSRFQTGGFANSNLKSVGLIGRALENKGNEVVFCFRNQINDQLFRSANTSLLVWDDQLTEVTFNGVAGFCDLDQAADYASARKAQMTQVSVVVNANKRSNHDYPLKNVNIGTDLDGAGAVGEQFEPSTISVYATSFIPVLGSGDVKKGVTKCLRLPNTSPATYKNDTLSECLKKLGVPYNTQVQNFMYAPFSTVAN